MRPVSKLTPRMISNFCKVRLSSVLSPHETDRLRHYLNDLLERRIFPPYCKNHIDCAAVGQVTGIDEQRLFDVRSHIRPVFDAMCRALADAGEPQFVPGIVPREARYLPPSSPPVIPPAVQISIDGPTEAPKRKRGRPRKGEIRPIVAKPGGGERKRGPKPREIVEFPEAKWTDWIETSSFSQMLSLHMRRHGDSAHHLSRAVSGEDMSLDAHLLGHWIKGRRSPQTSQSFALLNRIERRYRLPMNYFSARLPHRTRAVTGNRLDDIEPSVRRRLAWHLPDNFRYRPLVEQDEILQWVTNTIITGATDYRKYQAAASKQRYGIRFRSIRNGRIVGLTNPADTDASDAESDNPAMPVSTLAPVHLEQEMSDLIRFKTATLTSYGFQRNGVWNDETSDQKVEHLGLLFGAFIAKPDSPVRGYGMSPKALTFAMLVIPSVWDWYLQWREQRRGFYTAWESDMLVIGQSMVREDTGWLRQMPHLAERLRPVPGLISEEDVARVQANWAGACDDLFRHARHREKEISRVAKVHRDPFEPILAVLEADSPLGEYRKITEEILRLMPDERLYPKAKAEAVRSFLLLRLGLHLGLRQKNLRELLICPKDRVPTIERHLENLKRGELRWSHRDNGWEVLIPAVAFKNATSSFFGSKPFRLVLPDLGGLYDMIDAWISRHRAVLIGPADDPGTFFVKSVKQTSASAAYNQTTFYEAWKLTIQRYGIYNPYTGRGAIKGLLPHGPHNVRDVLATHILKQTGSYEQASYAIQDTPEMVSQHYGRFLPQDKAALAAQILNRVWEAA
ncbi:hypothetical protein [Asticcacaulis sp. YBE204]|uniref:hypothetical protein n=1 Tax=Asticcacaulis sp. YBE204 TaxID=1282363 RepID=UPI001F3F53B4|nr:hypothetical protein [Asticcacaulis sp. YBE204]